MKVNSAQLSMGAVSLAVGIMMSAQFSANLHSASNIPFKQWSKQEAIMDNLQKQNAVLLNEVIFLRNKVALESSDERSREYTEQLTKVNIAAGFTPVIGPGIVINLDDKPDDPLGAGDDANDYLIHYKDLLFIVNDLRGSGAEAISINDQRIIASTEIRCAGPTILVNTTRLTPPYEIRAIGNPEALEKAMRRTGGELQILNAIGMKISIEKRGQVEIAALNQILTYHYAKTNKP